jgi:sigma-B regulation protein RsbU (phosphoserine phosphatase)
VEAGDGQAAMERLRAEAFDLVLLDVMMPVLDGYAALCQMKADRTLREIPVIMISALDELQSVVRCIETGAEDYLAKPFEPTLLRARIGASLEKKALRDQERHYLRTIEETQRRLGKELEEAANYVRSILPPPIPDAPIRIDWRFIPSTELGGDSFGYHWLDDDHFAVYLLDVCGHGVGAALLSVAATNVLRSGSLAADFRDPASVLSLLNETFPMERHNNMYFTIWYGVYHRPTRTLRHSSGGHPPAFLIPASPDGNGNTAPVDKLRAPGLVVGVMPGVEYNSETTPIPEGSRLFVLSDGTYEIRNPDGMLSFDEFEAFFQQHGTQPDFLERLSDWITTLNAANGPGPLDDDFSIVCLDFQ